MPRPRKAPGAARGAVLGIALLVGLPGCAIAPAGRTLTPAPAPLPVASEPDAEGRCWATEPVPAIYDQVEGEVLVVPPVTDVNGTMLQAPVYRRTKVPRVVRPRGEIRFEAPCPDTLTPGFIASLQRALAARGYYIGAATGRMDGPTRSAIAQYQAQQDLDSDQLVLETARSLGLIAVPRESLN